MDVVNKILQSANSPPDDLLNPPPKEIDCEIDPGTLLVSDHNSLALNKTDLEANLAALTRDNVQLLVNKIWSLPTKCIEEVVVAELPKPTYVLPRARKVPKPKVPTKWEQFAKEKGIQKKKKGKSKLKWDDVLQKWTPLYGFKRAEAEKQKEWLVECTDDGKAKEDPFAAIKTSKNEKVAKNELQRLRNIAKAKKVKIPKVGLPSTEHFRDAKQLSKGGKIAEVSTASLGKFTEKPVKHDGVKGGKVTKKKSKSKKPKKGGQMRESAAKTSRKPKAGKGQRDFRRKVGGRKRRA